VQKTGFGDDAGSDNEAY